jgi:hypothetical protein
VIRRSRHRLLAPPAPVRAPLGWVGIAALVGAVAIILGSAGCGDDGSLGASCARASECASDLQCFGGVCQPRCVRRTDCGDGYVCDTAGTCIAAGASSGETCGRELDCKAGLACVLAGTDADADGHLGASCVADRPGGGLGAACDGDRDCRNGTCALGRCVDLCAEDADCSSGHSCAVIPRRIAGSVPTFAGCLPAEGTISWTLPVQNPSSPVDLAVPSTARSVALLIEGSDPMQAVGITSLAAPDGAVLYTTPLRPEDFYGNAVRHRPTPRVSVVQLPFDDGAMVAGVYPVTVSSFRPSGGVGTATPVATAFAKLDDGATLDLHFAFLDLAEHPCSAEIDGGVLTAATAQSSERFQTRLLGGLRVLLADAGIQIGTVDYSDRTDIHDLDGLEAASLDSLTAQASHPGGVTVFFVRSLAPAGLVAMIGRAPGAPGVAGTPASSIVVAVDALCYRSWDQLSRIVGHEVARYLGLPRAVEPDGGRDRLADTSDDRDNLLHFADDGGRALSEGQKRMLRRSPTLR